MRTKPLTRHEAAEITGLSIRTIDRMIADGTLPAHKFKRAVRIDAAGFQRWLESSWKASTAVVHTRLAG